MSGRNFVLLCMALFLLLLHMWEVGWRIYASLGVYYLLLIAVNTYPKE